MSLNDINNLSHAKWNYKYHIVFAPRYRRKVFYKEKRAASNNPRAAGRPYYTFTRYARNRGLCPHRKNPQFYWGVTFSSIVPAGDSIRAGVNGAPGGRSSAARRPAPPCGRIHPPPTKK